MTASATSSGFKLGIFATASLVPSFGKPFGNSVRTTPGLILWKIISSINWSVVNKKIAIYWGNFKIIELEKWSSNFQPIFVKSHYFQYFLVLRAYKLYLVCSTGWDKHPVKYAEIHPAANSQKKSLEFFLFYLWILQKKSKDWYGFRFLSDTYIFWFDRENCFYYYGRKLWVLKMTFGLANAPAVIPRSIHKALGDLKAHDSATNF